MVNKSKKSKSKRVPLRKKYKVLKKVKEHHRKKAKEAKKLPFNSRKKVEKDPGIPNDWPFKERELEALEARRAHELEELEKKKASRKERALQRNLGLFKSDDKSKEKSAGEETFAVAKIQDNSERSFYKELVKVIEASDVILEVLDARDPLGTRCLDMEKLVLKIDPSKRIVLVLNKIDLVPTEAVEKWLTYLREELPAIAFKCSTQQQRSNLCFKSGAETLIKLLKNYTRSQELKVSITVGIVGLPNVGKSSLINSLKRSRVVNVGSTPGVTRSMQEIQLDKKVKLLDCPGVVMFKKKPSIDDDVSIVLRNCKRIEKLDDPITPVKEIIKLCRQDNLLYKIYEVSEFNSVEEFLQQVAEKRGKRKKGSLFDMEAAARIVLHDWNEGKIPYYTLPPTRNKDDNIGESIIVSELGKEFNIDEVYKVPPLPPPKLDEDMLEEDGERGDNADVSQQDEPSDTDSMKSEATTNRSSTTRQHEKLYTAEGILDPRKRRAEKKQRNKGNRVIRQNDMDTDYDFKVDYCMRDDDANDGDDDGEKDPMAGIE